MLAMQKTLSSKILFVAILLTSTIFSASSCQFVSRTPHESNSQGIDAPSNDGPRCWSIKKILNFPSRTFGHFNSATLLFGTEIEFPLGKFYFSQNALSVFRQKVTDQCMACSQDKGSCQFDPQGALRVKVENRSLMVRVGVDPGVIEVTTEPLSYPDFESWSNVIEDLIFSPARQMIKDGYLMDPDVDRNRWSGHVNLSWQSLREEATNKDVTRFNQLLVTSLYVDTHNHPELAMGVLGGDIRNATPLALGDGSEILKLEGLVKNLNKGQTFKSLPSLAMALFNTAPLSQKERYSGKRYNLVNVDHLQGFEGNWSGQLSGNRIEMRGFYSPKSTQEMLFTYRILGRRLEFLSRQFASKGKATPVNISRLPSFKFENVGMQSRIDEAKAAAIFINYMRESGLNPLTESKYIRDPRVKSAIAKGLGQAQPCSSSVFR